MLQMKKQTDTTMLDVLTEQFIQHAAKIVEKRYRVSSHASRMGKTNSFRNITQLRRIENPV